MTVFELSPWDEAPPAGAPERPPIRTGLAASTSHNPRELVYAFDGDLGTRWLSNFMDFPLPPNTSRLIRLRQTGSTPMFYWSFHELELWERER